MSDIFICYSREDAALMKRLSEDLRRHGLSVWTDRQELRPGTRRWKKAIERAIEEARWAIVLLTPNAKSSEWVSREISYASALEKTVVPWLASGTTRTAVPIELIETQWIDATKDYDAALRELLAELGSGADREATAKAAGHPEFSGEHEPEAEDQRIAAERERKRRDEEKRVRAEAEAKEDGEKELPLAASDVQRLQPVRPSREPRPVPNEEKGAVEPDKRLGYSAFRALLRSKPRLALGTGAIILLLSIGFCSLEVLDPVVRTESVAVPPPGSSASGGPLEVPHFVARVNDLAHILDSATEARIEDQLAQLENTTGSQVAVLTIPSLRGEVLENYSLKVANTWALGRAGIDDGALLLVARDDQRMRLEVGYGLEPVLTDSVSGRILKDVMKPRFRNGDFSGGIEEAVEIVTGLIENSEALPPP